MRHHRPRRAPVLAATALLSVLVGGPLRSQSCADPATLPTQLDLFLSGLQRTLPQVESWEPTQGELLRQSIADFETRAAGLDAAGREALCELFQRYPELVAAPDRLDSELAGLTPAKGTESSCLLLTRQQFLAVFISSQVLQGVAAGLQTACQATACYSGICWVTCSLAGVANVLVLPFEAVLEESDYCGKDTHFKFVQEFVDNTDHALAEIDSALQNQVIPPLDDRLSSRASRVSLVALQQVAESDLLALTGQTGAIEADLAAQGANRVAFQETSLQHRIEENLRRGEDGQISLLQMPGHVGGLLEQVREVVADTLLANQAAGHDITRALESFDQGDVFFNQQHYKAAYRFYRKAYRRAVGRISSEG